MEDLAGIGRRRFLQLQTLACGDPNKRLVTFEAERNKDGDRVDEIRRKYMFRRHSHVPMQNPEPPI